MVAWQKTAAPKSCIKWLRLRVGAFAVQDNKGGQVFICTAETVAGPSTKAGASGLLMAGLEKGDRWIVIDGLGMHRADEAHFVDNFRVPWKEVADAGAGFAVRIELCE